MEAPKKAKSSPLWGADDQEGTTTVGGESAMPACQASRRTVAQRKEKAMFSFTSLTASLAQGNGPSISSILILVLGLLVAVVVLAILAPRLRIPYPVLLVLGGLLLGFVPGLPRFTLDPDVVFLLFLPPLLSASAWQTSWRDFHANLRPISLLALGLVLLTTVAVAFVAHVLIPDLPWAVAFVLGAIVSPTDAVAATSIAQRLGIPQRLVTILEGESLVRIMRLPINGCNEKHFKPSGVR